MTGVPSLRRLAGHALAAVGLPAASLGIDTKA